MANGMKALVTGGAGFIGSHMAELLLSEGWDVCVLDDLSSGSDENLAALSVFPGFSFVRSSVCDADAVGRAARGCGAVFHFAALVSVPLSIERPEECWRVNGAGFENVAAALRGSSVPFMYASSAAVYGCCCGASAHSEDDCAAPASPYAWSKLVNELQAELAWRVWGIPAVGFRFFNVYGPRQNPGGPYASLIPSVCSRIARGEMPVVFGDGLQTRDMVFVKDAVRLVYEVFKRCGGRGGMVFNAGSGRSSSVLNIVRSIMKAARVDSGIEFLPERSGDVRDSLACIDRIRSFIGGFEAVGLDEGLAETVGWYLPRRG